MKRTARRTRPVWRFRWVWNGSIRILGKIGSGSGCFPPKRSQPIRVQVRDAAIINTTRCWGGTFVMRRDEPRYRNESPPTYCCAAWMCGPSKKRSAIKTFGPLKSIPMSCARSAGSSRGRSTIFSQINPHLERPVDSSPAPMTPHERVVRRRARRGQRNPPSKLATTFLESRYRNSNAFWKHPVCFIMVGVRFLLVWTPTT